MPTISSNIWQPSQALLGACQEHGFTLPGHSHAGPVAAALTLLEDGSPASSIMQTSQEAAVLMESIRMGAGLLFTFGAYPSGTVYRLSKALPSTGWTSQRRPTPFDPKSPTPILITDPAFFSASALEGLAVPLGVDIRPVSAVERGQSRYERYRLQHPFTREDVLSHSDLWSRPLLNREWTLRASYDELAWRPLLVTGRYGAGRVAMLATSSAAVGETAAAQAFWKAVIAWLAAPPSSAAAPSGKPTLAMSFPSTGSLRLTITGASGPAQLVTRMLNRDGAMLADGAGESTKQITLLNDGPTVVDLPLPTPAVAGLCPDQAETSFQVRAGLLSRDGSALLAEQRALSLQPALQLDLAIENLYLASIALPGPGVDVLQGFRARMGLAVGTYAYAPGASLRAIATLSLQLENLAPMAAVHDLNQPDNVSVVALNDRGAAARHGPGDKIQGYGTWTGQRGVENAIQFTWSDPVQIRSVTLVGNIGAGFALHNPGQASLELNARTVADARDLDFAFANGLGQVRIDLPPGSAATNLTVRLPWVSQKGSEPRQEPWLGDIFVEGRRSSEAAASREDGILTVELVSALGGERHQVKTLSMSIAAGDAHSIEISTSLPQTEGVGVYRLEAGFRPTSGDSIYASAPILVISPRKTLRSLTEIVGPGSFGVALNVTNGFTKFSMAGTGTSEPSIGWSHPDDLVWAYSRQFKEIPRNARAAVNRLYASPSDMRHYSIPWREFSNGELFFPTAVGGLVRYLKAQRGWNTASTVLLTFADRWVTGPDLSNCNSWQEYIAFDSHLRSREGKGLQGRTHSEVEASLHADFENEWQVWQLGRYMEAVRSIREAFQIEGKDVIIYSQGIPGVAGSPGRELARTIRGMNDDFTWGMQDNSPNLTTGRTLGCVAVNPVWQMSTLLPWGFASPVFNNWQWHAPVSTGEPIRRLLNNRMWRGIVWDGGTFGALATYGYGNNVGFPYATTREEYQQWWYLQQRGSLLQPESPLGAGLIISTQKNADPRSIRWNGNNPAALPEVELLMDAFRSLSEAGVSLPFATNASTLAQWEPTPGASLIVLNLEDFSAEELHALGRLAGRVPIAVLCRRSSLSGAAAEIASQPGVLTIDSSPIGLTHPQAVRVADQLLEALKVPIGFSSGLSGYGFRCQDLSLVVVEDWLERARIATVQVRKTGTSHQVTAANLNDHSRLKVTDAGAFWNIAVPIRSGDSALIAVRRA